MHISEASESVYAAFMNFYPNDEDQRRVFKLFQKGAYEQELCYRFSVFTQYPRVPKRGGASDHGQPFISP